MRRVCQTTIMSDYDERVRQQIAQFEESEIHGLPEIFHVWSHNFIRPGVEAVFGANRVIDVYLSAAREASRDFADHCAILSIGCGDGQVEIDLAHALVEAGCKSFNITGLDLSPTLIARFQASVEAQGLAGVMTPVAADLNRFDNNERFNMIMANHSLHHIVDLEGVFDFIARALLPGGIFATCDMIGRNGHMRWPETEAPLQMLWPALTDSQRFHRQLRRLDLDRFVDHDCSGEGFEGVRAQDVLPLILERFNAYRFFGYGGFIDVLTDRGYGPGFDASSEADRHIIMTMAHLNDILLDGGAIKPTSMMAHFTVDNRGQVFYRNRTAQSSVRVVEA